MSRTAVLSVLITLTLVAAGAFPGAAPAHAAPAASFTVNSTLDEPDAAPGNGACASVPSGLCTLRAAIMETNALSGGLFFNVINLPASPTPYVLTRPGYDDTAVSGDLDIDGFLIINGSGAAGTIIDGNHLVTNQERVITILGGSNVVLNGVTIRNGQAGAYPSIHQPGGGGGIYNDGVLALNGVVVADNSALEQAPSQYSRGGGGIFNDYGATLALTDSTVRGNTDFGNGGGGLYNLGTATLRNSTVSGNSAPSGYGGGLANYSPDSNSLRLINSTLSGNSARYGGGGLFVGHGAANLYNATITGNTARLGAASANGSSGGGLYVGPGQTVTLQNTIVAGNLDDAPGPLAFAYPHDCDGALASNGHNLLGRSSGCSGLVNGVNGDQAGTGFSPLFAGLGPLADNGGPTQTHALQLGSPGVDAGNPFNCTDSAGAPLAADQRGYTRVVASNGGGARCDVGAFELAPQRVYLPLVLK